MHRQRTTCAARAPHLARTGVAWSASWARRTGAKRRASSRFAGYRPTLHGRTTNQHRWGGPKQVARLSLVTSVEVTEAVNAGSRNALGGRTGAGTERILIKIHPGSVNIVSSAVLGHAWPDVFAD